MANTEIIQAIETGTKVVDTSVTIKNKSLQSQTNAIRKLMYQMKANMFEIAVRLKAIQDGKLYEADGFEDVQDYAEQVFGYKKSMTYNLLRVADSFILKDGRAFKSIIAHDNNDYTVSQLQEVLTIEPVDVITLDKNAVISPDMTTKQIRSQVKKFKNGEMDINGKAIESDEADEAEETQDGITVEVEKEDAEMLEACKKAKEGLTALHKLSLDSETNEHVEAVISYCINFMNSFELKYKG